MDAVPNVNPEKRADIKILKVSMKCKEEAIPDPFLVAMREQPSIGQPLSATTTSL
jgi:hypothetical protein